MRILLGLVTLVALGLAACTSATSTAAPPARLAAAPTTGAASNDASASGPRLFALDGAFLTPVANGGRVAIANGWIEPHFSTFPPAAKSDLDIVVMSAATRAPAQADVSVLYEMLDMAHGMLARHAVPGMRTGHHIATMDLSMRGTWRFQVKVRLEGVWSTAVLVLSEEP